MDSFKTSNIERILEVELISLFLQLTFTPISFLISTDIHPNLFVLKATDFHLDFFIRQLTFTPDNNVATFIYSTGGASKTGQMVEVAEGGNFIWNIL